MSEDYAPKPLRLKNEFGDFQTPISLARRVINIIERNEYRYETIVEPTCGIGTFLQATAESYGNTPKYWGFDINLQYVAEANKAVKKTGIQNYNIEEGDFYTIEWDKFFQEQASPILVIGNPPWITNSEIGLYRGGNLPQKSNMNGLSGIAAKTGKSNFDISEWMLIKLIKGLQGTQATVAMLCKTATARKVLQYCWANILDISHSNLHLINASTEFGVAVDACLFATHIGRHQNNPSATVYRDLSYGESETTFGLYNGEIVSDLDAFKELHIINGNEHRRWRSGIKHDASKVMELKRDNNLYVNGHGERYELEDDYIYPFLKSSDLANGRLCPTRYVLVTQHRVGDPTDVIKHSAPRTWRYLEDHARELDKRSSSIYKKRPRYSIFGIGNYSFAPAKVAISGFYKNIQFQAVGEVNGKPIMVDDTCYFIPCESKSEADYFANLLNSPEAKKFISALVFMDSKRPITIDILKRIDLIKLARLVGKEKQGVDYISSLLSESDQQHLEGL